MNKSILLALSAFALNALPAYAWEKDACVIGEAACHFVPQEHRPQQFADLKDGKVVFAFGSNGDGCLASSPVAEIGGTLLANPGITTGGHRNGHCAYANQLDKATISVRELKTTVDKDTYAARIFSVYFVKDQTQFGKIKGHRHDWEDVVLWMKNGQVEYIGTSQHGPIKNYSAAEVPHLKSQPNTYAFKYVVHQSTHNFSKVDGKMVDKEFIPTNTNPTPPGKWFGEDETVYLDYSDPSDKSRTYWKVIGDADFGDASFKLRNLVYINTNIPSQWPRVVGFSDRGQ